MSKLSTNIKVINKEDNCGKEKQNNSKDDQLCQNMLILHGRMSQQEYFVRTTRSNWLVTDSGNNKDKSSRNKSSICYIRWFTHNWLMIMIKQKCLIMLYSLKANLK